MVPDGASRSAAATRASASPRPTRPTCSLRSSARPTRRRCCRPGTGLGLGIVREIMQRHGGTVEVESRLGRGTTVPLHFPPLPRTSPGRPIRGPRPPNPGRAGSPGPDGTRRSRSHPSSARGLSSSVVPAAPSARRRPPGRPTPEVPIGHEQVAGPEGALDDAPSRRGSRRTTRCRVAAREPRSPDTAALGQRAGPGVALGARRAPGRPEPPVEAVDAGAPARSWRSSTFWVITSRPSPSACSSRASASWAALGATRDRATRRSS